MAQFKPGTSGNPRGRKPGTLTNAGKLREAIAKDVPEILEALALAAKAGDTAAAKLLLDRVLPTMKPVDAPAPVALGDGLADAGAAVLRALAAGSVTPDQAGALAGVLSALARVEETVALAARVAALEDRSVTSK
jgi:hypothetical protein